MSEAVEVWPEVWPDPRIADLEQRLSISADLTVNDRGQIRDLETRIAAIAALLRADPVQDTNADLAQIEAAVARVDELEAALERMTAGAADDLTAARAAARQATADQCALADRVARLEVENARLRRDAMEADSTVERSMDEIYLLDWPAMVRAFHVAFDQHDAETPDISSDQTRSLRIRLIDEERRELGDALAADDLVEVADALADLLYVVIGSALQWGIPIARVFAEVHRSNMSKAGGLKRADGKIMKGPNYSPPDLRFVLEMVKP